MQAVLDLSGQLVKTRYQSNIHVQVHLAVRLRSLHLLITTHTVQSRSYNRIGRFLYRTLAGNNPRRMNDLLSANTLSEWVYGPEWGNTRLARYEAYIKTGFSLAGPAIDLLQLMGVMDEQARKKTSPSNSDINNALYTLLNATEDYGNTVVDALVMRNLSAFWLRRFKKPALERLITHQVDDLARSGTRLLLGSRGARRVTGWLGKAGGLVNGLSVVTSAAAFGISLMDTLESLDRRDERQAVSNAFSTLGLGATLAGLLTMNAIPVVGTALCIAGTVVCLAVEAWDLYWQYWGRSYWMGDTFGVYEDHWNRLLGTQHAVEYVDTQYGATPEIAQLVKDIKDQYQHTLVDTVENSSRTAMRTSGPLLSLPLWIAVEMNGVFPRRDEDVRWSELSWCAVPALTQSGLLVRQGEPRRDDILQCIDLDDGDTQDWLSVDERALGYLLSGRQPPENWDDEELENAKGYWYDALMAIKAQAETQPDGELAQLIWAPLAKDGRFPGLDKDSKNDLYSVNDLVSVSFPSSFNQDAISLFLQCWYQRTRWLIKLEQSK